MLCVAAAVEQARVWLLVVGPCQGVIGAGGGARAGAVDGVVGTVDGRVSGALGTAICCGRGAGQRMVTVGFCLGILVCMGGGGSSPLDSQYLAMSMLA